MSDQNNAPELPARIWAWSEDDDFLRAKPHVVMHGTEYIRADRAAPEGQVREVDRVHLEYAAKLAGKNGDDEGREALLRILAAITPPPAAPTDNTALVEAWEKEERYPTLAEAAKAARTLQACNGMDLDTWTNGNWDWYEALISIIAHHSRAALASREAPPACQQEAVTEITKAKEILSHIGAYAGSRIDIAVGHIDAALRSLKGHQK